MSNTPTKKKRIAHGDLDWHPADVVAAVHKAGWSLRRLSLANGYRSASTLKHALAKPWPKGEKLIAQAVGIPPESIWPSRYAERNRSPSRSGMAQRSSISISPHGETATEKFLGNGDADG